MHMQIMCLCLASRVSLGRWQPPINSQSLSGPPCPPHLLVADSRASRMSACTCSSTLHMQKLRIAVDTLCATRTHSHRNHFAFIAIPCLCSHLCTLHQISFHIYDMHPSTHVAAAHVRWHACLHACTHATGPLACLHRVLTRLSHTRKLLITHRCMCVLESCKH